MTKLYIASDHGGFELKEKIKTKFGAEDLGPFELTPEDDYPQYAFKVAEKVVTEPDSLGILICRSGIGMSIAANKVKGCYAALCFTSTHAKLAREHNHANILVLDSDLEDVQTHLNIVREFLNSQPLADRHERRVQEIKDYESVH